jgi:hypothetical protein
MSLGARRVGMSDGTGETERDGEDGGIDGEGQTIAIDFDDTLSEGEENHYTELPEDPDEEVVHWVNEQYREGHTIIVWTARPWDTAAETVARLTEWGVHWHGLRMEKGYADVYVDDKGTTPTEQLLEDGYDGDGELDGGDVEGSEDFAMNPDPDDVDGDVHPEGGSGG